MKCPECNEEMAEVLPAQVQLVPQQTEQEVYPSKIVCMLYHIFQCVKCNIKASKPESKDYTVYNDKFEFVSQSGKIYSKLELDSITDQFQKLLNDITNCNDKGCQGCSECEEHKTQE